MKNLLLAFLIFPCIELFSGQNDTLFEPVPDIQYCVEVDHCSGYVFRGLVLNNDFVLQPGITGTYRNFTAGLWSNLNTLSTESAPGVDEVDFYLAHEFDLYGIGISNTAAMYFYSGKDAYPTTGEYILKAAYYTGPVGYSSELAVDFMEYRGAFIITQSINYEKTFGKKLCFDASLSLSWAGSKYNKVNAGLEKKAFNYAGLDVSLTYNLNSGVYLKPHFQLNTLVDKELGEYIERRTVFYGVLVGYSF
ncbi:MAG: hypothetical protein ABI543_03735 [Ignavibacteria bacterium]